MKRIVITGTNRGIGKDLALFFLIKNFQVVGLNRTESNIIHENYRECEYNALTFNEADVSQLSSLLGDIDLLILNAGIYSEDKITEVSKSRISDYLQVNGVAPFILSRGLLDNLKKGTVVSIGSKAEDFLMQDAEWYSISKQVLKSSMESLLPLMKDNEINFEHLSLPRIGENQVMNSLDVASMIEDIL